MAPLLVCPTKFPTSGVHITHQKCYGLFRVASIAVVRNEHGSENTKEDVCGMLPIL